MNPIMKFILLKNRKNLFNKTIFFLESTKVNCTLIELPTGIKISTNSAGTNRFAEFTIYLIPNTVYTFTKTTNILFGGSGGTSGCAIITNSTSLALITLNKDMGSASFTVPANGIIILDLMATKNTSEDCIVEFNNIQLELGFVKTEYEQF